MPAPTNIPALLMHNTLGIYDGKYIGGSAGPERFENSFNVARARLVDYGYLSPDSEPPGEIEAIALTGKGRQKNREKTQSIGTSQKQARFNQMWDAWRKSVDGDDQ